MAEEIKNAKVLWGGGIVRCTTANTAEYLSSDSDRIEYLSGDTYTPGLLLSADTTSGEAILRAKTDVKNNTDADAFVYDNGKVYVYKTPCTSKMECKYNVKPNADVKLFNNNAYIWFMSLENDKFTVTCDYNDFGSSGSTNIVRMPNNTGVTSNYFRFKENGTVEYHFTQKGIDMGQTPANMFEGCTDLVSCNVPCEMRKISDNTFKGCTSLSSYTKNSQFITEIGNGAFNNCTNFTTLLIPKHAKLNNNSFNGCTGATILKWNGISGDTTGTTIKCNMTSIPDYAFLDCVNLQNTELDDNTLNNSLVIPSGITSIGSEAFTISSYSRNRKYKDIYFNGVENIGNNAFSIASIPATGNSENIYGFETVKTIGERAFYNNSYIENLVSGKTGTSCGTKNVTEIGAYAFQNCYNLKNFEFGNDITEIKNNSFTYCCSLTKIDIPDNVITIGYGAFYYCSGLTSCTIGNGVTSIDGSAFHYCLSLKSCTIGSSVTSIGDDAFRVCTSLTSIVIPNSVTSIGYGAFYYCSGLTSCTIGSSVTSIGQSAFYNCSRINSLNYNASCAITGSIGLSGNTSLRTVVIGDATPSIGENAFQNCGGLTSCTLGNSVTSIGRNAFYNCNNLTSINIPNSVTNIGNSAFMNCISLPVENNVRYADTCLVATANTSLTEYTIKEQTRFIASMAFYNCSSITSIDIPDSVTSIGASAFFNCSSLTGCTIGTGVTYIDDQAFYYCTNLSSVTIEATTPPALGGSYVFGVNASDRKIYVPSVSVSSYQTASGWSAYASYIEAIP